MSVYTAGGPYSEFEKASDKAMKSVLSRMDRLQKKVVGIMERALSTPSRSGAYWSAVERELAQAYNEISRAFYTSVQGSIPSMFNYSIADVQKRIDSVKKITETARRSAKALANSQASRQITTALITDAVSSMDAAVAAGYRNAKRITRMTQQAIIEEWVLDSAVAEAYAKGDLVGKFSQVLSSRNPAYKKLIEAFKGERVIEAGSKHFTPEYYAEMVARTKFHEAQSFAAREQARNYGTDLVVISNHNTTTVICQEHEAKTYSISGNDKRFPALQASPPYHPNCLHLMYPVFESAMVIDGTLEGQSAFSKGETNRPPVPAGYVPLADRGAA